MKIFHFSFILCCLTSCQPVKPSSLANVTVNKNEVADISNVNYSPRVSYDVYKDNAESCLDITYKETYIDLHPRLTAVIGFDRLAIDLYRHDKIDFFKNKLDLCFSEDINKIDYPFFQIDSIGIERILTKKDALIKLRTDLQLHQDKLIEKFTSDINKKKIGKQIFEYIEQCQEHAKAMIEDKIENKVYSPNIRKYYDDCLITINKFKGKI